MKGIDINISLEEVEQKVKEDTEAEIMAEGGDKERFSFEIISVIGRLSEKLNAPVLSRVKWDNSVKYDLRKWNVNMSIPYKGIVFDEKEIDKMRASMFVDMDEGVRSIAVYKSDKVTATIYANIAVLSTNENKSGWRKEINIVDWGQGKKVDIRKWKEDYSKCSKGISITKEEFQKLLLLLKNDVNHEK